MRGVKSMIGVIAALLPVVYCGGLFFYFLDTGGSARDAVDTGLGPTLLGLGAVGLLFFIPLVLKVLRALAAPRPGGGGPDAPSAGEESTFDADAALARYLARKPAESTEPSQGLRQPAARPSFGRKIG